ncbi:MAG TPA: hypothetical protein DDZ66_09670 [Firmicutes bacterium]|jgi:hypothetical protein|nr:hypothetical protein [Bacillota bacterium]
MKRFLRLLRKDLQASLLPMGFLSGITLILMFFTRFKISTGGWPIEAAFASIVMPLVFLPLWLLWQSFQTLRTEWREDTVYTLLVLPVPGWQVMLAKLLAIWIEYTVLLGVTAIGTLLFFAPLVQEAMEILPSVVWALRNGLLLYLIGLALLASVVIFVQLAFVISKMAGRVQGLVAIWTLILSGWLVEKLGVLLEPLFRWMPKLPLHKLFRLDELRQGIVAEWNLAPEMGTWLGILAILVLTSYLFEHYVEVNG